MSTMPPAPPASPAQWEYFVAPILNHVAQQILNNYGSEGWELVAVVPGRDANNSVGYFKRPLQAS